MLSKKELEILEKLSEITLTESEKKEILIELNKKIKTIDKIKDFKVCDLEVDYLENIRSVEVEELREDIAKPSMSVDKILYNAPEKEDNAFLVPRVVD